MSYITLYLFISFLTLIGGITYLTILKDSNFLESEKTAKKDNPLNDSAEVLVAGHGTVLVFYCALLLSVLNWGLSSRPDIGIIVVSVLLFSALVIFLKGPGLIKENGLLILASTLGIILMLESSSLIGLYIGVEAYSLCGYCLASGFNIHRTHPINGGHLKGLKGKKGEGVLLEKVSIEAGLKYFLLSALSSGLLLAGMSLVYGCTGSFRNDEIYRIYSLYIENSVSNKDLMEGGVFHSTPPYGGKDSLTPPVSTLSLSSTPLFTLLYTGASLITGALIFKIGGAPFHSWVADVYEKVSTTTTFYLILVPKIGLSYVLFILSSSMPTSLIYLCALLSFIVGALGGLVQKNLIRLIAFSSINHVAYICSAIYALSLKSYSFYGKGSPLCPSETPIESFSDGLGDRLPSFGGLELTNIGGSLSLILYLVIYGATTLSFFSIYYVLQNANFRKGEGGFKNELKNFKYVYSLKRLFYRSPYLAISLTVCIFSMAGVPPFAGFLAKFAVYSLLLEKGCYLLASVAVITSVIVLAFYLGIVKTLYFSSNGSQPHLKMLNFDKRSRIIATDTYSDLSAASALLISLTSMAIIFYPFIMQNIVYLFYFNSFF